MGVDRLHVVIEGRVQGVGFRFSTYAEASALGLTGWVRNLYDGRVEAEFEGPREVLDRMLTWCRSGPSLAQVTNLEAVWDQGEPRYAEFSIRG